MLQLLPVLVGIDVRINPVGKQVIIDRVIVGIAERDANPVIGYMAPVDRVRPAEVQVNAVGIIRRGDVRDL